MERKIHIDLLRIFAISLVVYNHTGLFGYREEIILNGGWDTCIGIVSHIFSEICRMGVPLFFMISGALLLKREETIQQLVTNRIVRFVAFIILFCFIQNFYVSLQQGYPVSFKQFLNSLFFGEFKNGVFVYWFMHVYLAMLLLLPFMRPIVKSLKKEHYIYLIALQTILCALYTTVLYLFVEDAKPPLSNVQAYMPFAFRVYDMPFTGMQWFYFIILGYFVEHIVDYKSITRIQWLCLILLAIGCLLLGASMLMIQQHRMPGSVVNSPFMTTYLTIPMLVLYMGVKTMGMKLRFNKWFKTCIASLGAATIMVFALENLLRMRLLPLCYQLFSQCNDKDWQFILANLTLIGTTVLFGCIAGIIVAKIPGLRWIVGAKR